MYAKSRRTIIVWKHQQQPLNCSWKAVERVNETKEEEIIDYYGMKSLVQILISLCYFCFVFFFFLVIESIYNPCYEIFLTTAIINWTRLAQ